MEYKQSYLEENSDYQRGYKDGWADREADFMVALDRIGPWTQDFEEYCPECGHDPSNNINGTCLVMVGGYVCTCTKCGDPR